MIMIYSAKFIFSLLSGFFSLAVKKHVFDSFCKGDEEYYFFSSPFLCRTMDGISESLEPSIRLLILPHLNWKGLPWSVLRGTCNLQSLFALLSHHYSVVNRQQIPPSVLVSEPTANTRLELLLKSGSSVTVSTDVDFDMIISVLFLFLYSLVILIFL